MMSGACTDLHWSFVRVPVGSEYVRPGAAMLWWYTHASFLDMMAVQSETAIFRALEVSCLSSSV